MQKSQIDNLYSKAFKSLHKRKVLDSIVIIKKLISATGDEYVNDQLDRHIETYKNIIRYSFFEVKDPDRDDIYNFLLRSLLELADELREKLLARHVTGNIYALKTQFEKTVSQERQEAFNILEAITLDRDLASLLEQAKVESSKESLSREDALIKIFNIIWLTDKYSEQEISLLNEACNSKKLPWHDKCLVVSALTLSLLRYFDVNKFYILFKFVKKQEETVWQRAMVGLFMTFLKYNERFYLYPSLKEETEKLKKFPDIQQNIEAILIQFTKSKETEKVKRKWEEDIMPSIIKMRPKIEEKLDLDNIFKDPISEEENPDWETVFEDSPDLLNKLQEFTEMQMDGMDVFISAFSQLKNFSFFNQISNWFVPFYSENIFLKDIIKNPEKDIDLTPLTEKLEQTYFMCNSDKYSFCLNLNIVPDQQKTMMMNMLNAEMKNISEIEKDEDIINSFARTKSIYTQYFQDIYRFFKLHPWKNEIDDIFTYSLPLYETNFVKLLVSDQKTIRNIGEFYFDKKFYPDALNVFEGLLEEDKSNIELFEKIAFCYQKTGDFENALDYYKKADLIETDRNWIILKIAFCLKYLNRWEEALIYYRDALKNDSENLNIQANIGQCLVHLHRYEEALEYYFKIEVLAPENIKIRRPLAWCSFLLGKYDTAKDYFERLLENEPNNKYDLMNLAHVFWCKNEQSKAVELYVKSIKNWGTFKDFEVSFNEDRKHLTNSGIDKFDIDLMLDYLKMKTFF